MPACPKSWSSPEPPVSVSLPSAAEQVRPRQRAARLVERDHVIVAEAEDPDQRGVGDRGRATADGHRAAVDQDHAGCVAADLDRVGGAVTEDREYAVVERRGCGGTRRRTRHQHRSGAEHDTGEQPARRPSPRAVTTLLHRSSLRAQPKLAPLRSLALTAGQRQAEPVDAASCANEAHGQGAPPTDCVPCEAAVLLRAISESRVARSRCSSKAAERRRVG